MYDLYCLRSCQRRNLFIENVCDCHCHCIIDDQISKMLSLSCTAMELTTEALNVVREHEDLFWFLAKRATLSREVSYYYQAYDWLGKLKPDKLSPQLSKWGEGGGSQEPLESGQAVFIFIAASPLVRPARKTAVLRRLRPIQTTYDPLLSSYVITIYSLPTGG